jgi:4-hydroxy-tetrahydrodipicolinate synthase
MAKAVDYEGLTHEVQYLDRCGVPGMVWPQLFSVVFQLTKEERIRGMETIAKAAKGRRPAVVFGVQGPNTAAALEYLERAESLHPDAFIALPPTEGKTLDDFIGYFRALGRATTRPIFIQNADTGSGLKPPVDVLLRLATEFPHLGYFKEEIEPALERMQELSRHRPPVSRVFSGNGGKSLLYEMRLGFDGCMAGNAYADVYVDIWNAFQSGQQAKARDLYGKLLLIMNCEQYIPGVREYMMKRRGIFKTTISRRREVSLSMEDIKEIEFQFEALRPHLRV